MPVWFIDCTLKPPDAVLAWHHSQGPLLGIWLLAIGLVTSDCCISEKLTPESWQRLQPDTIPVWFIVPAARKSPMTVRLGEWQFSQGSDVGMCPDVGSVLSGGLLGRNDADEPWQLTQPVAIPVWFIEKVAKPPVTVVFVWQEEQSALVGMWPEGCVTIVTPGNERPAPWQVEQLPVFTAA
jgi:hypothetical protein